MAQREFFFTYWGKTGDEEKFLTLKITPAQWEGTICPNGYLFTQGGDFAIFVNKRVEVIDEKSSPDWKDWFEIYVSEGGLLQVYSMRIKVNLSLPEPIIEGAKV